MAWFIQIRYLLLPDDQEWSCVPFMELAPELLNRKQSGSSNFSFKSEPELPPKPTLQLLLVLFDHIKIFYNDWDWKRRQRRYFSPPYNMLWKSDSIINPSRKCRRRSFKGLGASPVSYDYTSHKLLKSFCRRKCIWREIFRSIDETKLFIAKWLRLIVWWGEHHHSYKGWLKMSETARRMKCTTIVSWNEVRQSREQVYRSNTTKFQPDPSQVQNRTQSRDKIVFFSTFLVQN